MDSISKLRHTILQVEDDPNDALLLRHAFHSATRHPTLQLVEDGAQAIDYLSGAGKYADPNDYPFPDLVLLDLKMPGVGGFEVLQWVRRQPHLHCLTVIIFSSSRLDSDVLRAYELGANCFLTKPTDLPGLKKIAVFLNDWLSHAALAPCARSFADCLASRPNASAA